MDLNRINELFKGVYHKGITDYGQLEFVQNALKKIKKGRYTWSKILKKIIRIFDDMNGYPERNGLWILSNEIKP